MGLTIQETGTGGNVVLITTDAQTPEEFKAMRFMKKMAVNKSDVARIRLRYNPETLDIVKVFYNDGTVDELHFSSVDKVGNNESIDDNGILFDELIEIFAS